MKCYTLIINYRYLLEFCCCNKINVNTNILIASKWLLTYDFHLFYCCHPVIISVYICFIYTSEIFK